MTDQNVEWKPQLKSFFATVCNQSGEQVSRGPPAALRRGQQQHAVLVGSSPHGRVQRGQGYQTAVRWLYRTRADTIGYPRFKQPRVLLV